MEITKLLAVILIGVVCANGARKIQGGPKSTIFMDKNLEVEPICAAGGGGGGASVEGGTD